MYIDKIYLQENYRRHPGDDPFLFGTVGVGVHINPDESIDDAIQLAKQQIKEFIANNTHYPEHNHVEVKDVRQQSLSNSLVRDINSCTELTVLKSYSIIVKGKPDLQTAYDEKFKELSK
jgi:hypothetical protein